MKKTLYNKNTKKKAFTLIELLIVIAIIGILFIVLVSKVDFATDKAKATGVQTDFRSFQVAFEQVSRENAGFNTFGWDTGDTNGDHVRNSYDVGDTNKDGVMDAGETWTGRKSYTETWTGIYTLVKPGADVLDSDAIFKLETAINANLDPKLHITIADDGTITMANGAQDPWNTEYHGFYITNAETDGKDRGAIIIYSNGANQEFGSEHNITNGVVIISIPGNNVDGKDDYAMAVVYSYNDGYGDIKTSTSGFSPDIVVNNNGSSNLNGGNNNENNGNNGGETPDIGGDDNDVVRIGAGLHATGSNYTNLIYSWDELVAMNAIIVENGEISIGPAIVLPDNLPEKNAYGFYFETKYNDRGEEIVFHEDGSFEMYWEGEVECFPAGSLSYSNKRINFNSDFWVEFAIVSDDGNYITFDGSDYSYCCGQSIVSGDLQLPDDGSVIGIAAEAFFQNTTLTGIKIPNNIVSIGDDAFSICVNLSHANLPESLTYLGENAFSCTGLNSIVIPSSITEISDGTFSGCQNLTNVQFTGTLTSIGGWAFSGCLNLNKLIVPNGVTSIGKSAFDTTAFESIGLLGSGADLELPNTLLTIDSMAFFQCAQLKTVILPNVTFIGKQAFSQCDSLVNFRFPNSMTYTGESIFVFNDALTSVGPVGSGAGIEIPNSIKTISDSSFDSCTSLISVELPDTVTTLSYGAFEGCTNLKSVKLSTSITSIGMSAFSHCINITSVGPIGSGADLEIPSNVTTIGTLVFNGSGLVSVELPEGITSIGTSSFRDCKSLTHVSLPNTLRSVGSYAFGDCTSLTYIKLPASITSLSTSIFYKSAVEIVEFEGTKSQWINLTISAAWKNNSVVTTVVCSDGNLAP